MPIHVFGDFQGRDAEAHGTMAERLEPSADTSAMRATTPMRAVS
jgi:hypothetical protein